MKWPWSKKEEVEKPKTMEACLASDRPDLHVSLWLQDAFERMGLEAMPPEVANAYLTDRFLCEVNGGGLMGLFRWQFDYVPKMSQALLEIGAEGMAQTIETAITRLPGAQWPINPDFLDEIVDDGFDDLDQSAIAASGEVEQVTHRYIRKHLDKFV